MRLVRSTSVLVFVMVAMVSPPIQGQTYRHAGTEFEAVRPMLLPEQKKLQVGVAEFHHHGLLREDGKNVLVVTADRKPVATRVLQQSPGDFCRVAFQVAGQQREYYLFYGGDPPKSGDLPEWSNRSGLLLETREYRQCNLNSLESVKEAFENSRPLGSGYVNVVQHGSNPFILTPAPFLSRYSGTLHIDTPGKYGFLTSSEDCSFLLIDEQVVVSAPGRHGPEHRAKPGNRKDIQLDQGPHKFEYYHAASGPNAMMVAAWEPNPRGDKPAPVAIPASAFRADSVGPVLVGPPETQQEKLLPHFSFEITGSVPLPENPQHLLGVQFENLSPPALQTKSRIAWEFGDGQTSDQPSPEHVFLRPGLYPVKLAIQRGVKKVEITYTIQVDQRQDRPKDPPDIDRYLPILETYEVGKLDAASLQQLVLTYLWKAELVISPESDDAARPEEATEEMLPDPAAETRQMLEREAAARQYYARAVDAAKVAFMGESTARGEETLFELARLAAPIARNLLGDSRLAGQIWQGASQRISRPELRAECELAAADIALNDMLLPDVAKTLLDKAEAAVGKAETGDMVSRLHRVWGDYHATVGDGARAREDYAKAQQSQTTDHSQVEQIAWRGAHSRSTEQFLKSGRYGLAAAQLHAWQTEFPSDKLDGYLHLLLARYWAGRGEYAAAIAQADQLLAINSASPYADQLLSLAAECEEKRDRIDRALATFQSLLHDYPGSPLVPHIQGEVKRLKSLPKQ